MARKSTKTKSSNTIETDGVEVYTDKIYSLVDQYIDGLTDPDAITGQNKACFNGLLKYIQRYYFRYHKLDYSDIESIDNIFNIYTSICYKYNKRPTILGFCLMVNISMDTLNSWKNQNTRQYIYFDSEGNRIKDINSFKLNYPGVEYTQILNNSHSETVKKWLAECEAALYDGATEQNSIGCIFALKANYGYTETAPAPVEYSGDRRTPAEIAAAHGLNLAEKSPELLPVADFITTESQ